MIMKKITILAAATVLLAGCFTDDRDNFMVPDTIGMSAAELLAQASVHTGSYTVGVAKNGKGQSPASVTLSLEAPEIAAALDSWNEEHGTQYKALPAAMFTLSSNVLEYDVEDVVRTSEITWDPVALAKYVGSSKDFVLPVCVNSDDLDVNPDRQVVFVNLLRTSISVAQKSFTRVIDRKKVEPDKEGNQPELKETLVIDLKLDNSIHGAGLTFPVKIDDSLIADFNATQEEMVYQQAPQGLVTILTPTVTIPEGGQSANYKIELDKSVLLKDGKLEAFPNYVIPVTIDTKAMSSTLNGKDFELKGLSYGQTVTYITLTYLEIKPGLSVSREWGLYSSDAGAWSSVIDGFTAGSDRNVALDDDYIYIAETNKTKHIWAISRTDPANARLLPVGTVADEGIFYVSCPRIIANTDPAINGGKDVLAVSSMTEGDPKLYIYTDGIDADPVKVNLTTWNSRRLGDTYTFWGTLQQGVLFFKDFNTAQGTVTFPVKGINEKKEYYLAARLVAPPVTGAGAYFPFPDNMAGGICSVRGGSAWLVSTNANFQTAEGAVSPTLTELSGYFADTAYRFFELGGKRYVAYTRQVSSSDGRLFILEGTPEQSWADIVLERNIIYQAAIQADAENLEEYEPSPMGSGNSGMDLDARMTGGDVYIAVVKQNVGLSLFRLTYND